MAQDARKRHATSHCVKQWINGINKAAPINLEFATVPVRNVLTNHIVLLESMFAENRMYRFMLHLGVHPILLFVTASTGLAMALTRLYRRSRSVSMTALGVAYPSWCCWQLVKQPSSGDHQVDEYQAWLTYWILYGMLQVMDHWSTHVVSAIPNYPLYKALFLYWAQNPRSQGARLFCRHILQKPQPHRPSSQASTSDTPLAHAHLASARLHNSMPSLSRPTGSEASNSSISSHECEARSDDEASPSQGCWTSPYSEPLPSDAKSCRPLVSLDTDTAW